MAEQAHAIAALDDLVARRGQQARRAPAQPALAPRPTGQQRLHVGVPQAERRVESGNDVRQTRPRTRLP
jgi:hypothetical protein